MSSFTAFFSTGAKLLHRRQANRRECMHSEHTCQYYSNCVEPRFPCGHNGFILSFAEERCKVIESLEPKIPGEKCASSSCVDFSTIDWAHGAESCFKSAIEDLYQEFMEDNQRSDPSVCLKWEQRAVEKMNECYAKSWGAVSDEDARILTKLFRVDEYFANVVDQGIPLLVSQANSALASRLLSNNSFDRNLFCVRGVKGESNNHQDLSQEDVLFVVEESLRGQSLQSASYHYGGVDGHFEGQPCKAKQPGGINSDRFDFHLVSLFLPLNTSITEEHVFRSIDLTLPNGDRVFASGFELSSRIEDPELKVSYTQCGDGMRQSGEECDYGSGVKGCSINCQIMNGYDCSVERLAASVCWPDDDGNEVDGDGCDLTCSLEQGHSCTSEYNRTSTCQVDAGTNTRIQFAPKQSPSYITARRLSAPSKVLVETHSSSSKRTLELPLESSSIGSFYSSSVTVSVLLAVLAILTNLNLWR